MRCAAWKATTPVTSGEAKEKKEVKNDGGLGAGGVEGGGGGDAGRGSKWLKKGPMDRRPCLVGAGSRCGSGIGSGRSASGGWLRMDQNSIGIGPTGLRWARESEQQVG